MNCVYAFSCKDQEVKEFYIGYTKNLTNRITTHRNACKIDKHQWYKFVNDNGGFDNWVFNIIEEDCEKSRERFYIEELKPQLNNNIPGRTKKEYDQSEQGKKFAQEYYSKNKDKILKQIKEKADCPHCGKNMRKNSISRHIKKYCKKLN